MRGQAGQGRGRRSDGEREVPLPGRLKRINKGLFTQERGADGARQRPEKVWTPANLTRRGAARGGGGPGSMRLGSGTAGVWTGHGWDGSRPWRRDSGEVVGGGEDVFPRVLPSPDVSPGPHSREQPATAGPPLGGLQAWSRASAEHLCKLIARSLHGAPCAPRCPASAARAVGAGTAGTSP